MGSLCSSKDYTAEKKLTRAIPPSPLYSQTYTSDSGLGPFDPIFTNHFITIAEESKRPKQDH